MPWNSSKMHWKTFLQNPLRPSRSVRYGNDRNKKNGKHKSVRKIFCFTVSSYYIIYTRIFDPPLSTTKSGGYFLSDHLFFSSSWVPAPSIQPFFKTTILSASVIVESLCAMTSNVLPFVSSSILF